MALHAVRCERLRLQWQLRYRKKLTPCLADALDYKFWTDDTTRGALVLVAQEWGNVKMPEVLDQTATEDGVASDTTKLELGIAYCQRVVVREGIEPPTHRT
jgi:hypothetical protein